MPEPEQPNPKAESPVPEAEVSVKQPDFPVQEPAPQPKRPKDLNKVYSSWRWDVEPTQIATDNVGSHFQRVTDLYAYHGLPIVKDELGEAFEKKAAVRALTKTWKDLTDGVRKTWTQCFNKFNAVPWRKK